MEIIFDNVSYIYQEGTPLENRALKDINLTIPANKITALIGHSGSGKTTLVELINGLLTPTLGSIKVEDFLLTRNNKIDNINNLRFKVGLVFQFPEEQFFNTSVREEVEFGMKNFNYKLDKIETRVEQALKMVGLNENILDKNPFELSNGEKRKVAIASSLIYNPQIIILDEPTVGLDGRSQKTMINLIRQLKNKYNKTIIIISHDIDMLYKFVDNVVVLKDGEVLCQGGKYEVLQNVELLRENNIGIPRVVQFCDKVYKTKNIKLGNYCEVNDLIKVIYRNV
ncbi:MAG: ATP-binding cassette domain-containing protein [Bacilli bacterium]|nr:ATP-binding cassette domain-containing protein [Bacilli bacterium]